MDKFKLLVAVIIAFIFLEGAGLIFFAHRAQNIKKVMPKIEQMKTEKEEIAAKYDDLESKYAAIERDRNNLLLQTKQLLSDKGKVEEAAAALQELETLKKTQGAEIETFQKEKDALLAQIDELKALQAKAEEEKGKYKAALDKRKTAREPGETVDSAKAVEAAKKEQAREIAELKKESERLKNEAEKAKAEVSKESDRLLKAEKRIAGLRDSLEEYRNKFLDAQRKNSDLDKEARDVPNKFSELARQNKQLVKETAQMHYNLGVFYTDNKEYRRAIAEFEKAAEINPEDAHSHFNLGYIYAEYMVDRPKAIDHFRYYLRYAEKDDKDVDWVKKYLLTWETFEGKGRHDITR